MLTPGPGGTHLRKTLLIALIVGPLLATSAGTALATQWVQFRYDSAQSGINPEETSITTSNVDEWQVDWEVYPTATRRFTTSPLVTEDAVIVGGWKVLGNGDRRAAVWSYDLDTGAQNWVRPLSCGRVAAPSMGLGAGLIVATLSGCPAPDQTNDRVAFLDATTGTIGKTLRLASRLGPPTISGDMALFDYSLNGDTVLILDLVTMTISSSFGIDDDFASSGRPEPWAFIDGNVFMDVSGAAPVLSSDGVLVTNGYWARAYALDGSWGQGGGGAICPEFDQMCAVDLATNELLWSKPQSDRLSYTLAVGDVIYHVCAGTGSSGFEYQALCAFDLHTGEKLWTGEPSPTLTGMSHGWRPIFVNGVVFIGGYNVDAGDNIVVGYDAATGERIDYQPGPWPDINESMPGGKYLAVANGRLVTSVPAIRVVSFG